MYVCLPVVTAPRGLLPWPGGLWELDLQTLGRGSGRRRNRGFSPPHPYGGPWNSHSSFYSLCPNSQWKVWGLSVHLSFYPTCLWAPDGQDCTLFFVPEEATQCLVYDGCFISDGWMDEWSIVPAIRRAWSYRASGLYFSNVTTPRWASVSSSTNRVFVFIQSVISCDCYGTMVRSRETDTN